MTEENVLSPDEIADKEASEQVRRTVDNARDQEKIFGTSKSFEAEFSDNNFDSEELTEQEIKFIEHFMIYQNPASAVIEAGIKTVFPRRTATRLLQKETIQRFLKSLILQARQNVGLTLEQHLRALADIRDRATAKGDNKTALGAERSRGEAAGFYTRLSAYEMDLIEKKNQVLLGNPDKPFAEMDSSELKKFIENAMRSGVPAPKVLDVEPNPEDTQGREYENGSMRSMYGEREAAGVLRHSRVVQRGIADGLKPYQRQTYNVEGNAPVESEE